VSPELLRLVGEAWGFRACVEHDAALRFARLAQQISEFDAASPAVALMRRAAEDEQRHAGLCEGLAASYGHPVSATAPPSRDIAPATLGRRAAVLYEVVAACCVTETESVATLATLLAEGAEPAVRTVLHEIARDEVVHGKMGWAHLAREAEQVDVRFLSLWIPVILSGTVGDGLFAAALPAEDSEELLRHGVLPQARKRELFVRTLTDIVLPGLETFGVDAAPARAWLNQRSRQAAHSFGVRPSPLTDA
jgi:hypothetical protein